MPQVRLEARAVVKDLDELRNIPPGEPFAGRIDWPERHAAFFFVQAQPPQEDNFTFISLPNEQIHRVTVQGRDVQFFDAKMMGSIQPLFESSRARIETYQEGSQEYRQLTKTACDLMGEYHRKISNPQPV